MSENKELELDSIYFKCELEEILPRIYEKRRAPLSAERLIPMTDIQDPDMERFTARSFDHQGKAHIGRVSEPGCKSDVPIISASMSEESYKLHRWKIGFEYTDREIRVARKLGRPLDTKMAEAALYELQRFENEFLMNGDSLVGAKGLLDPTLMTQTALTTGSWDNPATTAEQMLKDLEDMALSIERKTDCVYMEPVTIVLPCAAWNFINSKPAGLGTDTTVLQYFLRNWGARVAGIEKAREFDAAKKALVYIRDSRYMSRLRVPVRQVGPVRNELCEYTRAHLEMGSSQVLIHDSLAQCAFTGVLA